MSIPRKIVVCSQNQHKIREISSIVSLVSDIVSVIDFLGASLDVVEDGDTFEENALKKVLACPSDVSVMYLGDDSGLEVAALGNRPGVYSARYAGEHSSSLVKCETLLGEMQGEVDRSAAFTTVIAVRLGELTKVFKGVVEGVITHEMKGESGFGYDPIFIPKGALQTFSEMTVAEKNASSHRYRALLKVNNWLSTLI